MNRICSQSDSIRLLTRDRPFASSFLAASNLDGAIARSAIRSTAKINRVGVALRFACRGDSGASLASDMQIQTLGINLDWGVVNTRAGPSIRILSINIRNCSRRWAYRRLTSFGFVTIFQSPPPQVSLAYFSSLFQPGTKIKIRTIVKDNGF